MGTQRRDSETFTVCNVCDTHGEFTTRSDAYAGMMDHLAQTGHTDQRYSTPTSNGWKLYHFPETT